MVCYLWGMYLFTVDLSFHGLPGILDEMGMLIYGVFGSRWMDDSSEWSRE